MLPLGEQTQPKARFRSQIEIGEARERPQHQLGLGDLALRREPRAQLEHLRHGERLRAGFSRRAPFLFGNQGGPIRRARNPCQRCPLLAR